MENKLDALELLTSQIGNITDILVKPERIILSIEGKGDLKNTFPLPVCSKCKESCCHPQVNLTLFDIARLLDCGLDDIIIGTYEKFVEAFLSGSRGKMSLPYMRKVEDKTAACTFLDENGNCSRYEDRPMLCHSHPLSVKIIADKSYILGWDSRCQSYEISSDKAAFQELLDSAVQHYNEKLKSQALLKLRRNQLRELGFGKYMENEWHLLVYYYKRYKEAQKQLEELQQEIE